MTDSTQVPVHGRNLRYAHSQLSAAGVPHNIMPAGNGIYIIIIAPGYAPATPWAHQPPSAMGALGDVPFVPIAMAILLLVVAWFAFQAAPALLAMLVSEPAAVAQDEPADENPLAALMDSITSIPDKVTGELDRRVTEVKQDVTEAVFSTVVMTCGLPLLLIAALGAAFMLLRIYRGRR
jgi:hypothetical protein